MAPADGGHRTVNRVAALLELAAGRDAGIRLSEAVTALAAPTSSVHSLLRGLETVGYLSETHGRYRLGPALGVLLGRAAPESFVRAARPELERLAGETGETAILGTRVGNSVAYLDQAESAELIRYAARLHERRPLAHTSIGKLYLAELDPPELGRLIAGERDDEGASLRAELDEVRRSGIAYNLQETVVGVAAAAAGIRVDGELVAAISVAGPSARVSPKLAEVAAAVRDSVTRLAGRISAATEPLTP